MSKRRKASTADSTASGKGFMKEPTGLNQNSVNPQQESIVSAVAVPPVMPSSEERSTNDVTFTAAMLHLQVATLDEVVTEGAKQIEHYVSQINELIPQIGENINK